MSYLSTLRYSVQSLYKNIILLQDVLRDDNSCIQQDRGELADPVFRCPVRNITRKYPGTNINHFLTSDFISGVFSSVELCPDFDQWNEDEELLPPVNPSLNDDSCTYFINDKPRVFRNVTWAQCKNNCPGGDF